MRTLKLTLEYDGTRYSGWQQKANAKTVAGELIIAAEDFFSRQVDGGDEKCDSDFVPKGQRILAGGATTGMRCNGFAS